MLANQAAFAAFESAIARLANWNVIAAVLMPDHVHLLIAPDDREAAVGNASGAIKRWMRQTLAAEWQWQPGSFDRLLRSDESTEEKWQYIRENPVARGLVENWQDWPYRVGFELEGGRSACPGSSSAGGALALQPRSDYVSAHVPLSTTHRRSRPNDPAASALRGAFAFTGYGRLG